MRLPHHLLRHPSGMFHFRLIVPRDLRAALSKAVVKISLRTRDPAIARGHAYALGARYAAAFAALRSQTMAKPPSIDDVLRSLQSDASRSYEVELPNGVRISSEGAEDHARAMEALRLALSAPSAPNVPSAGRREVPKLTANEPNAAVAPSKTLGAVVSMYLLNLAMTPLPDKTRTQKRAAVQGFATWKGAGTPMSELGRTDVAEWLQSLRLGGLSTPTLTNKASYLKACIAWAQAAGYFPPGDNPASGQVKYSKSEKRQRKKLGFRPFTLAEVERLYSPAALAALNEQTRWGAVIGLYTGARVTEVGQLALDNFYDDDDGVWCVSLTDEGAGQSLKNDASKRTIPVHPELIALGLRDRVERLRAAGESQLFPRAKVGSVNGMGNWLSKSYGRHLSDHGIKSVEGRAKVGFHSLRDTMIQRMQKAGVTSEARAQYVGHELDDEHHATYSGTFSNAELLRGVGQGGRKTTGINEVTFALDLAAIREAITPARI